MAAPLVVAAGTVVALLGGYVLLKKIEQLMGRNVTLAEEAYFVTHPWVAFKVKSTAKTAYDTEAAIFGCTGEDDEGDAFRHCFWSAVLTREVGFKEAGFVTSLHEQIPGNPVRRMDMDLFNNAVGRMRVQLGNDAYVARQVLKLLLDGRLSVIAPNAAKRQIAQKYYDEHP